MRTAILILLSKFEVYLYLFAKNGFTKGCMEVAGRMENVTLVQYKELLEKITG